MEVSEKYVDPEGDLQMDDVLEEIELKKGNLYDLTTETAIQYRAMRDDADMAIGVSLLLGLLFLAISMGSIEIFFTEDVFSEQTWSFLEYVYNGEGFEDYREFREDNTFYDISSMKTFYLTIPTFLFLCYLFMHIIMVFEKLEIKLRCPSSGKMIKYHHGFKCPCCEKITYGDYSDYAAILKVVIFIVVAVGLWFLLPPIIFNPVLVFFLFLAMHLNTRYKFIGKCGKCTTVYTGVASPFTGEIIYLTKEKSDKYVIQLEGGVGVIVKSIESQKEEFSRRLKVVFNNKTGFERDTTMLFCQQKIAEEIKGRLQQGEISDEDQRELLDFVNRVYLNLMAMNKK